MEFTSALMAPAIDAAFYDNDIASRTVQVQCAEGTFFIDDLIKVLSSSIPIFSLRQIEGIWKTEIKVLFCNSKRRKFFQVPGFNW